MTDNRKEISQFELRILKDIRFCFLHPYSVAGMGEPWSMKLEETQQILKKQGIDAILTLTEDDPYGKLHREAGFAHHHEPVDDCEPPSTEGMNRAIEFINSFLEKDIGVAVHCLEGRGRTGTILCAWIGLKESLSPEQAIRRIHELMIHAVITPSQRSFLKQYLVNSSG